MSSDLNRRTVNKLNELYYELDSPASYAGVQKVFQEARKHIPKLKLDDVKRFLHGQSTYTLYKPARKRFKRLATVPAGLNTDWQCDLAIMDTLYKNNDGFKYILVCIDVLSRKIFTAPAKSKSPKFMKEAFTKIFQKAGTKPHKLYSDRGLEFQAREMLKFFEENDIIKHVVYSPDIHAGVVERANRTIKDRLYRYFHKNKTHRWVDVLDKVVNAINNSVNRTTGLKPSEVSYENAQKLHEKLFMDAYSGKQPKYQMGDIVRISKDKGIFGKGYHPSYTNELFKIKAVKHSNPPHYKLEDLKGDVIMGVFYEPELSFVRLNTGDQMIGSGRAIKPIL